MSFMDHFIGCFGYENFLQTEDIKFFRRNRRITFESDFFSRHQFFCGAFLNFMTFLLGGDDAWTTFFLLGELQLLRYQNVQFLKLQLMIHSLFFFFSLELNRLEPFTEFKVPKNDFSVMKLF